MELARIPPGPEESRRCAAATCLEKELAENLGPNVPLGDDFVVQVEYGHPRWLRDDLPRTVEVVLVMVAIPCICDDGCNCAATATSAAGSLLIVRDSRSDIAQTHAQQAADVDSHLHRCRHREDVNSAVLTALRLPEEVLKPSLDVTGLASAYDRCVCCCANGEGVG